MTEGPSSTRSTVSGGKVLDSDTNYSPVGKPSLTEELKKVDAILSHMTTVCKEADGIIRRMELVKESLADFNIE